MVESANRNMGKGLEPGRRSKLAWIALGLIAAVALAVFGGMMLGEFAGISRGEVTAVVSAEVPSAPESPAIPEPLPSVAEQNASPDVLPALEIVTSLAHSSGVTAIGAGQWVRPDDLPLDLFRTESVSGTITIYLTVESGGSAVACTVANSSEVTPERFLRPAAVGVCRALRERARFEPFVIEAPTRPRDTAEVDSMSSPALKPEQETAQQPEIQSPSAPPVAEREVLVRVVFRTLDDPAAIPATK